MGRDSQHHCDVYSYTHPDQSAAFWTWHTNTKFFFPASEAQEWFKPVPIHWLQNKVMLIIAQEVPKRYAEQAFTCHTAAVAESTHCSAAAPGLQNNISQMQV